MVKKYYFIGLSFVFLLLTNYLNPVYSEENKLEQKIESASGNELLEPKDKITFTAKKSSLWVKESSLAKNKKDTDSIEVTLPGELFITPKQIPDVAKLNVDRSTPFDSIASIFSAARAGDYDWIISNFVKKEQGKVKKLYKNNQFLEGNQKFIQEQKGQYISGFVKMEQYIILLVEQINVGGKKIIEPIAFEKTDKGWLQTTSLTEDEVYDVIFASLGSGEVKSQNNKGIKPLDTVVPKLL